MSISMKNNIENWKIRILQHSLSSNWCKNIKIKHKLKMLHPWKWISETLKWIKETLKWIKLLIGYREGKILAKIKKKRKKKVPSLKIRGIKILFNDFLFNTYKLHSFMRFISLLLYRGLFSLRLIKINRFL